MNIKKLKYLPAVPKENLAMHPDAEMPIDDADKFAIKNSMEADCMHRNLTVINDKKSGHYLIIDGRTRFEQGKEIGKTSFDCDLVECKDVRLFALDSLSSGRKITTGQRIMAFIEAHKKEVLDAWAINSKKGENYRKLSKPERSGSDILTFQDFSANAISVKLGCDECDVAKIIEMYAVLEEGKYTDVVKTKTHDLTPEMREAILAEQKKTMEGSPTWRRWKSAFRGRHETKDKLRSETNYAHLLCTYPTTFTHAFTMWDDIKWTKNDKAETAANKFNCMYAVLPQSHRAMIRKHIMAWPKFERENLYELLQISFKKDKEDAKKESRT